MFFAIIYLFVGCKVKRMLPDNYEIIEDNFCNGNYRKVVELLNSPDIKHKEKTNWYYFFYGNKSRKKNTDCTATYTGNFLNFYFILKNFKTKFHNDSY